MKFAIIADIHANLDAFQVVLEDIKQQKAKNGNSAVLGPPNVRAEVLRLAARRDRELGEEFLGKLKVEKAREATEATDRAKGDPVGTPEAITQRMRCWMSVLGTETLTL